jgi:hypothetical protein
MKPALIGASVLVLLTIGLARLLSTTDVVSANHRDAVEIVDLDGAVVDPFDVPGAAGIAFIFMDAACPVAARAVPSLNRLHDHFSARGVRFWLVYPGDEPSVIRQHLREFELRVPALRDPGHVLVAHAGVTVTPEAAVFAPARRLVYRGRIDDRQIAFGTMKPVAAREDLREALDALVSGRFGDPVFAPAIGCYIRHL